MARARSLDKLGPTPPPSPAWRTARAALKRTGNELHDVWLLRRDPTYRRLAASYELPDGSRRVYCYHVRKTAGTSLFLSFLALGGEDPSTVWRRINQSRLSRTTSSRYAFASNNERVLTEGAYFFGRSHHPAHQLRLPPQTFTVTVLRDPVERIHSYYDYLVAGDDVDQPGRVAAKERRLAYGGFDAFLARVPLPDLLTQLAMFSKRLDASEAAERIAACSFVFTTGQFESGLATLADRLGIELTRQRSRVTSERSTLSATQRQRLRARLEPEYELLRLLGQAGVIPAG